MAINQNKTISYQGEPGANSHLACLDFRPDWQPLACATFEGALEALKKGKADLAMIPVENSVAGRVADVHHLLPDSGLYIVGERFEPIHHQLLGVKGAQLSDLQSVSSHVMALGQCRNKIKQLGLLAHPEADTAGSARLVFEAGDKSRAAIASVLAAEIYGLDILAKDIEDAAHNTTRFLILSASPRKAKAGDGPVITTFVFRVRNVPAALYKTMGGFATNGVNMTKLESYQPEGSFNATMFYADIEGHPDDPMVRLAMEELTFFSSEVRVLGVYKAAKFRSELKKQESA
ncbi:MAG: prephenate dehydratase [Hyphomicrobiaceae bacterium]|nr:prephenate dehydratase [Hyphomicrobiaceae bacterium]